MMQLLVFVLLSAPVLLSAEKPPASPQQTTLPAKFTDSIAEETFFQSPTHKTANFSARKPKRAIGEIPLLIIRPIDKKKKKAHFKEPMVKLMSGGVASYGNYPEIHTNEGEIFSLEHMLPILGLEGMVFNGIPKIAHYSNHFAQSQQYKPSDTHYFIQKNKEQFYPTLTIKPTETVPDQQPISSPPSPNYAPAVSTEEQLLKLGQQALGKLETPSSSAQPQTLVEEKPAFIKPELLHTKYNFNKLPMENMKLKAIPVNSSPNFGPTTFFAMHSDGMKLYKPSYVLSSQPQYKWSEIPKKPQMVSPLSISTSFYSSKPSNAEESYQSPPKMYHYVPQQQPQQVQQQLQLQHQQPMHQSPIQTHVNYYFPKEIETLPQPQPQVQQLHTNAQQLQHPTVPVNTVQNGEHVDFVIPKQPVHEETSEKPYKSYHTQMKYKLQKHPSSQTSSNQPTFYIHKEFEFPSKSNGHHSNSNNVVTEYHGSYNRTTVETQHLPEPVPYSAPQYLPLPQPQPQQQPAPPALTLHQSHPVPQPQPFQHNSIAQSHWKRRNHEHIKPVVEITSADEPDSAHSPSTIVQTTKTLQRPVEKSTTEVRINVKHVPQSRTEAKPDKKVSDIGNGSGSGNNNGSNNNSGSNSTSGSSSSTARPTTRSVRLG
ncbi:uncharacterized protein LOC131437456 [Malaya genurostris]|uniref:uncharacterized protein LOC131437456 n=1 Tax=Malaya genurostris TaxID=325434 RepID=UPI0026F38A0F|nr:uncharacterized protein LOC131437456 [Malaya genurostris]